RPSEHLAVALVTLGFEDHLLDLERAGASILQPDLQQSRETTDGVETGALPTIPRETELATLDVGFALVVVHARANDFVDGVREDLQAPHALLQPCTVQTKRLRLREAVEDEPIVQSSRLQLIDHSEQTREHSVNHFAVR